MSSSSRDDWKCNDSVTFTGWFFKGVTFWGRWNLLPTADEKKCVPENPRHRPDELQQTDALWHASVRPELKHVEGGGCRLGNTGNI